MARAETKGDLAARTEVEPEIAPPLQEFSAVTATAPAYRAADRQMLESVYGQTHGGTA